MIQRPHGREGFTLVELLVVIAIIAIIAGLVVPGLMSAQRRAYVTKCTANLKAIHSAAFLYAQRKQMFPFDRSVKEPRAHESLNTLIKAPQGEGLDPETFDCPEGAAIYAPKDLNAKGIGYLLDADSLDYTWLSKPTKGTKKCTMSSDKFASGIDDMYSDGEVHEGHYKAMLVLDTTGRVIEVEVYEGVEQRVRMTDDLIPVGVTR